MLGYHDAFRMMVSPQCSSFLFDSMKLFLLHKCRHTESSQLIQQKSSLGTSHFLLVITRCLSTKKSLPHLRPTFTEMSRRSL